LPASSEPIGDKPMTKFFKRAFDLYVTSAGNYPLPMVWAF
jgi:hypothetical protein